MRVERFAQTLKYLMICLCAQMTLGFATAATSIDLSAQQCRSNADCRFNEKCDLGRCVDQNSCRSDYDCSYGQICEWGRCQMAECRGGKYDCRAGEQCRSGRCEYDPTARRCVTHKDCPTYERCSLGYCQ